MEIRAKIPTGDWLRPSFWLVPKDGSNGIAVMESRGNRYLIDTTGKNYGTNLITSTLYYSTATPPPAFKKEASGYGFDDGLHTYKITWTPTNIEFSIDGVSYSSTAGVGGGGGGHSFDKECYILINLGVGGKNFVPAGITLTNPLPWTDTDASPATSFWNDKDNWLPTWEMEDSEKASSMIVDYVKVTAS